MRNAGQRSTNHTRTVYVASNDVSAWRDAVSFCAEHNVSLSRFVADALRWYLLRLTSPK